MNNNKNPMNYFYYYSHRKVYWFAKETVSEYSDLHNVASETSFQIFSVY